MKQNSFDPVAADYDDHFSNTLIGKAQRDIVWKYLKERKIINKNILELNCGTGEDAIFLAVDNFITATDASIEMLQITNTKINTNGLFSKCSTLLWDLNYPFPDKPERSYDVIFSNFGGLNCVSPIALKNLSIELYKLLNPGGRLIFVLMGRFCLWEWFYFNLKGKFKEANRRQTKLPIQADLNSSSFVNTWYYSPKEIKNIFIQNFKFVRKKPVGLFLPPSYMNPFFKNKKWFVQSLIGCESVFGKLDLLAGCSDHYLIELNRA